MILAGDIGGTKTNLALFKRIGPRLEIHKQAQFESRKYPGLSEIISDFAKQNPRVVIGSACFGIAGPVINGRCRTTNLPWDIASSDLRRDLNTDKVHLMNDLEATAYGMLNLDEDDFVDLNPTASYTDGNKAVIAAGTGLGEGMLFYDRNQYYPIASEGGHTDLASLTSKEDELLTWLRRRYPDHVSYERILSGAGIYTLYEFLSESGYASEPASMTELKEGEDRSAHISRCALEDNDPLCVETLRMFCDIYGAEAGNLALKTMSLGGVYLGGGIAPKILPFITDGRFMKAFAKKGRFEDMLRSMQVKVSLNTETALLGAAYYAADKL